MNITDYTYKQKLEAIINAYNFVKFNTLPDSLQKEMKNEMSEMSNNMDSVTNYQSLYLSAVINLNIITQIIIGYDLISLLNYTLYSNNINR